MKIRLRALSLLLCLSLLSTLLPPASAAGETAAPTQPSWCPAEEYAVFSGSAAYEPENWALILELRAFAETHSARGDDFVLYAETLAPRREALYEQALEKGRTEPTR